MLFSFLQIKKAGERILLLYTRLKIVSECLVYISRRFYERG